jgi:hypothetical protein
LTGVVVVAILALFASRYGMAAEGGYSNYIPGTYGDFAMAVAPEARWTIRNDIYYYTADDDRSVRSGRIEADADLEFTLNMTTILHKPGVELLGAQFAFGAFVPVVHADIEAGIEVGNFNVDDQGDTTGLGDLALIPLMLFWTRDNLHMSFAQYIVTPTGRYDADDLANPSLNYWSFDTNFALTHLSMETGREFSFNVGYIYNTENSDTNYQTGQELHLDAAFNQFFSESFAVGIQGFYLKQITGDSGDGALLGDFKGEAAGIGPAFLWNAQVGKKDVSFIAKWLHEFDAERRIEGDHFFASFALGW